MQRIVTAVTAVGTVIGMALMATLIIIGIIAILLGVSLAFAPPPPRPDVKPHSPRPDVKPHSQRPNLGVHGYQPSDRSSPGGRPPTVDDTIDGGIAPDPCVRCRDQRPDRGAAPGQVNVKCQ